MSLLQHLQQNRLFSALPENIGQQLFPHVEYVALTQGQVIHEPGGVLRYVYFPTSAIISLLYVMESGASAELAAVGNEGLVSVAAFMGGESTPNRAVVQSAGYACRIRDAIIKKEFAQSGPLQNLLLRYTQALLTLMSQTAACNRHHYLDQQLSRWLLLCLDRLPGPEITITQEQIANLLGVRREGVTEAAGKLQKQGLIQYSRGHITVLDRPGLEHAACECYAVVKHEFARLLPYLPATTTGPTAAVNKALVRANRQDQKLPKKASTP